MNTSHEVHGEVRGMIQIMESETNIPTRRDKKLLGITYLVLIYAGAAVLLLVPALFLGFGVQALGGKLGIWVGDPTSNDGEETWATIIGLVSGLAVLAAAAWGTWSMARRHGLPPRMTIAFATGVVFIGYLAWLVTIFG